MGISQYDPAAKGRPAWNAGKQVGIKRPLKVKQIWLIRFLLDREGRLRDRALFDLAISGPFRSCLDTPKSKTLFDTSGSTSMMR